MLIVLVTIVCSATSAIASSVGDSILSQLKQYSWNTDLQKHEKEVRNSPYLSYNTRYDLARYLELKGLYQAEDTPYCIDIDDISSCYIGTKEQNLELLRVLKTHKVQKHLSQVSIHKLVNDM